MDMRAKLKISSGMDKKGGDSGLFAFFEEF